MDQSQAQFEQSHTKLESQMELTDARIAKIQSRDKRNVFTEHVRIGCQFEIWVEKDETEEKNQVR